MAVAGHGVVWSDGQRAKIARVSALDLRRRGLTKGRRAHDAEHPLHSARPRPVSEALRGALGEARQPGRETRDADVVEARGRQAGMNRRYLAARLFTSRLSRFSDIHSGEACYVFGNG